MSRDRVYLLLLPVILLFLVAFAGDGRGRSGKPLLPASPGGGNLSTATVDHLTVTINGVRQSRLDPKNEFVPGETIVKFKPSLASTKSGFASVTERFSAKGFEITREFSDMNVVVLRSGIAQAYKAGTIGEAQAKQETIAFVDQLRNDPLVLYAEPNYIRHKLQATLEPDDPLYPNQWNYPLINLPQAWSYVSSLGSDASVGQSEIVVAVLDNGIVRDQNDPSIWHEDLNDNILMTTDQWGNPITDGYDFVSDAGSAADGDDDIPAISGDGDDEPAYPNPGPDDSHGTHVTGTVSAVTNNTLGVAGAGWNVKIMPIRVLGIDGGTDADIVGGVRYASRFNTGVGRIASRTANVINMSLGGRAWDAALEDALREAYELKNVVLVGAAGNDAYIGGYPDADLNDGQDIDDWQNYVPGNDSFPGDYSRVITVGAVSYLKYRSIYSTFSQNAVDICAPGGNIFPSWYEGTKYYADNPSTGLHVDPMYEDTGILSTVYSGYMDDPYQGTSMAAPHVAGVIALMQSARLKSGKRLLTPMEIGSTLPFMVEDLGPPGKDDEYGYGLIDAYKAVQEAVAPSWIGVDDGISTGGHSGGCFIDASGGGAGGRDAGAAIVGMVALFLLSLYLLLLRTGKAVAG
ncbi:MAG: hypothetical protein A2Z34_06470 [Planctomycetes bacterium RBG_16_59_8]|nr:MAG: hypothetical protein A2Z34_06470 [Planctomycetes bacterium RBG_16_59_8]